MKSARWRRLFWSSSRPGWKKPALPARPSVCVPPPKPNAATTRKKRPGTKPPTPLHATSWARVWPHLRMAIWPTVSKRPSSRPSIPSVSISTARLKSCSRPCARSARTPPRSMPVLRKCFPPPTICRAAPNSRRPPSRKPLPLWKKSPPRFVTVRAARKMPAIWSSAPAPARKNPALSFAGRLPPCARSKSPRAKSAISSVSSTISPSRPTCWR
ncbi:hypothetical protein D3C80_1289490 [compost metagenome]